MIYSKTVDVYSKTTKIPVNLDLMIIKLECGLKLHN